MAEKQRTVTWSNRAGRIYLDTLEYLAQEFSQRAAENLIEAFDQAIARIAEHPTAYRQTAVNPRVHFILVGKHRRLYYRVGRKTIRIVFIFDTRQDPKKDPFR